MSYAEGVFYSENLVLLIVGAALFCVLSILFKQKSVTQFVGGIIFTVLFCVIGFVMQNNAIMTSNIPPNVIAYARSLSLGFGFAFPMVLGVLFLVVLRFGTNGLSLGNLIATIIVLVLVVLTNQGFQQLITPKRIS